MGAGPRSRMGDSHVTPNDTQRARGEQPGRGTPQNTDGLSVAVVRSL